MPRDVLTELQKEVFKKVVRATLNNEWYRAARSGERVTLASLHTRGLCRRRAWRGIEGQADAAHEYQVGPEVQEELYQRDFRRAMFEDTLKAHLANPSKQTWDALATKVVPTSTRTVWQAWVKIDANAPVSLPATQEAAEDRTERWPSFPDPFTTRRAVRAALEGRVPSGLNALLADRGDPVPINGGRLHLAKTKAALAAYDQLRKDNEPKWDVARTSAEVDQLHAIEEAALRRVKEAFAEETADRNPRDAALLVQPDDWLRRMVAKYGD